MDVLAITKFSLQLATSKAQNQINPIQLFIEFAQTVQRGCEEKSQTPNFNSKDFKNYLSQQFDQLHQSQNLSADDKAKILDGWYRKVVEDCSAGNKSRKISLYYRKEKSPIEKQEARCNKNAKLHKNVYYLEYCEKSQKYVYELVLERAKQLEN
jgi:flagellar hook-basal body complex protein FliE